MQTTRRPSDGTNNEVLLQATLLGILALVAVAIALLAQVVPDVTVELPVTPTFSNYPISPHTGF